MQTARIPTTVPGHTMIIEYLFWFVNLFFPWNTLSGIEKYLVS